MKIPKSFAGYFLTFTIFTLYFTGLIEVKIVMLVITWYFEPPYICELLLMVVTCLDVGALVFT